MYIQFLAIFIDMKQMFFFLIYLMISVPLFSQWREDFSDGNFTESPAWAGHTDRFAINQGKLQLKDPNAGASNISFLSVGAPTSLGQPTTWEFSIQQIFAPSTGNFAKVYLQSSHSDLSGNLTGYFLKIGGITGNDDALELHRQDGSGSTLLLKGTAGSVANDPSQGQVRIVRDQSGNWELWADYNLSGNYVLEGSVADRTYTSGNFFGWVCTYTSTRKESFFLDDILINPLFQDAQGPKLQKAEAINSKKISVFFDEPLSTTSATEILNYVINNGIGNPAQIAVTQENPNEVELTLATDLQSFQAYQLSIENIQDLAGNLSGKQSAEFTFFDLRMPEPGDLILTELLPDPSPAIGMPDSEFLELYNRSNKALDLKGVGISTGSSPRMLPSFILMPGEYVIICPAAEVSNFSKFGQTLGIESFPALTNSEDDVVVTSSAGEVLVQLHYSDSWYQEEQKKEGGWSLELILLNGPADCAGNWRASIAPAGGTPGKANSLLGRPADTTSPILLRAVPISDSEISVVFSEPLGANQLNAGAFSIDKGIAVQSAFLNESAKNQVLLVLGNNLQAGITYQLTATSSLTDCIGNSIIGDLTVPIGLPENIEAGDLIINEILFFPATGASDFIECYNRSNKVLNLKELTIYNSLKKGPTRSTSLAVDFLLFPGAYIALSENIAALDSIYQINNPRALLQHDLPSFDSDEGNATLEWKGTLIDSLHYEDSWHYSLLADTRGVSLERLDPEQPTQSQGNWHSAASTIGYATPGYLNSQWITIPTEGDEIFDIPNTRFSPDGDGFEDVLQIQYRPDQSGLQATMQIFDATGRLVKHLVRNALLESSGSFKWDGTTDDGFKARIGIYIVAAQIFSANGKKIEFKKPVVLAGKL